MAFFKSSMALVSAWLVFGLPQVHASECGDDLDASVPLTYEEREQLINKLRISNAGKNLLQEYQQKYGTLKSLSILWDNASFSEISTPNSRRAPAREQVICVHLAENLPEIENVADLAHELTHAARLDTKILRGDVHSSDAFVQARLSAQGGEADAFSEECHVKYDILGKWDALCAPYVSKSNRGIDTILVLKDLYNGQLSASLTGEPYPIMLARQFNALHLRRKHRHLKN